MNNELLTGALIANAVFSATTGLAAVGLAGRLSASLGPPAPALRILGIGLVAFAVVVARESREPGRRRTRQIIAADVAWVIVATLVAASAPTWLTGSGRITTVAVTAVVAAVAAAQWRGLDAASWS